MLPPMDGSAGLCDAEHELQLAIRTADLAALERLLDDRFVHVGPDGAPQDKRAMLAARAAGRRHAAAEAALRRFRLVSNDFEIRLSYCFSLNATRRCTEPGHI